MLAQLVVKEILSRTSSDFQGLSRNFFLQFKDFPGFSRPMDDTLAGF
jgi:hypothetical protein